MTLRTILIFTGVTLTVGFLLIFIYLNSALLNRGLIFSPKAALSVLWENYKKDYIDDSGRVLDKQQGNVTTSEGQSYALLRAVWIDDQISFDKIYGWTVDNLQHKTNDSLFSWLYGDLGNGTYGVLVERGGQNTATDADTDIALALIFAYERWKNPVYLNSAKAIISSVWSEEIVTVSGVPYVVANNIEKNSKDRILINPSYLSPYSYRIFSKIDKIHNWMAVVDSSYKILEKASSFPLDKKTSSGLPPNWLYINTSTGSVAPVGDGLSTDFGFDALRVPWRISLDYEWFKDPRAKTYLNSLNFLQREWRKQNKIYSVYSHDGVVLSSDETHAMYAGVIGYFKESDDVDAKQVYKDKIETLFDQDKNAFVRPLSYYDANWVWFGLGLYNDLLPNLSS